MRLRVWLGGLLGAALIAASSTATASAAVPHTVTPGETLWSIAAANNLTTATVAAFNGMAESDPIVVGQIVQVPTVDEGAAALAATGTATTTETTTAAPAEAAAGPGSHAVVAGETLSSIAANHGVAVDALAAANGRSLETPIYEGESLAIPAASAAPTTTTSDATAALGATVPSPYGELPLDPGAAESWNAMRDESLSTYGQDLYPAGPLSAGRTYEQQAQLYEDYLNGTGPLAAPPGTSAHESGTAVDLADPAMRSVIDVLGPAYGWGKTEAPSEWWHINWGY